MTCPNDFPHLAPVGDAWWSGGGEEVLVKIWQAFLDTLDERGLLEWDEVFVDASFSPAKKAIASERPNAEGGAKWLAARMVRGATRMPDRKWFAC